MHPNLFRMNCEIGRAVLKNTVGVSGAIKSHQRVVVPELLIVDPEQAVPGLIPGRMNGAVCAATMMLQRE